MKYTAILNGKERTIAIEELDADRYQVTIDGETTHIVDAGKCSDDAISLLIDNRSYDMTYTLDNDAIELNFWNQYFNLEILDERRMRMRLARSGLAASGPEIIKSSMPGKIVKLLVKEGDAVEPGTGIIIMEAMKMENEIRCKNSGIVKSIAVAPGDTVESNVTLVEIAPPEE